MRQVNRNLRLPVLILVLALMVCWGQLTGRAQSPEGRAPGLPLDTPETSHYLPHVNKAHTVTTVNSCTAIQQAIDSLPAEGGLVTISGTFVCSTPLIIARDHVELRGDGPTTVLRLAEHANAPVLIIGDSATPPASHHDIRVSGLTIDGNQVQQTQECWGGPCDSGGTTYIRNNGITVRGVQDVLVENVSVHAARSGGLVSERVVRRLTVRDFTSYGNYYDGLAAYQTEDSLFSGLYLHDNPFAGLSLDIDFVRNIVAEAVLADNGKQGIFMRDSRDNLFTGIQIRGSGEQGLFLAQATEPDSAATGNTFSGLVVSGSAQVGMRINDATCTNNLLSGAQLIGNGGGCLSEATSGLIIQSGVICR